MKTNFLRSNKRALVYMRKALNALFNLLIFSASAAVGFGLCYAIVALWFKCWFAALLLLIIGAKVIFYIFKHSDL